MPDLRQALKDFVATSNSGKYPDEKVLISKFPELRGYNINSLKDFVATSNSGNYQSEEELFAKFPEFRASAPAQAAIAPAEEVKKKVQEPMAQMAPQNTTESFVEESLLASQPKPKPGILAQPVPKTTTESFLATASSEPSIQPTKVSKPKAIDQIPKGEEKSGYLKTLYDNLALGASYANESIFSLPETVINVLSIPQNYIAEKTGWNIGSNADILKQQLGIKNPILDWVQENQKVLNGEVSKNISDKYTDSGIVSNFSSGNYQDGFELLGASIAQSVPISIGFMLGGAYTAPAKLAAVSTLALTENQRQELEEMDPNMSESEKTMKALAMSGAESLFSSLGTGTIGKVYKDIAKREGTEAAKGILKDGLVQTYKRALEKGGAVTGFVGEGIEEAATTITQNVISGKPAFEGAADAFATGAGSGVVFTAPISAINAKKYIQNKIEVYDTKDKIGQILKDKSDNIDNLYNVSVSSDITSQQLEVASLPKSRDILVTNLKKSVAKGDITEDDAKQSLFVFDKIQQVSGSLNDLNVSVEDKAKVASLLKQRDGLKTKIQNKDDVLVVAEKQQIEEINNQIQLIISKAEQDAIQEQTAGQVLVQSETGTSLQVAEGEPQAEPQGVTQEVKTEEVTDEKSQQIGTQIEDLVNTLSDAWSSTTEGTPNEKSARTNKSKKAYKKLENFFGYDLQDSENENQIVSGALYNLYQMLNPQGQGFKRGGKTYKFANINDLMSAYKNDKAQGVKSDVSQSIDTLFGIPQITPQAAPQVAPQENQAQVETLRAQEQTELMEAIPNATQYVVDGKVDRTKISDPNDLETFDAIYDKYDKLITPLLQTTEVSSETQITPTQQDEQAPSTPPTTGPVAGNRLFNNPLTGVSEIAKRYYKRVFRKDKPEYFGSRQFDEARAKRISDAFIAMQHEPNNPQVKKAYEAMAKETIDQYNAFLEAGYRVEINNEEPYANSQEMIDDLRKRKRIKIYSTESGFGETEITPEQREENPLLKPSGYVDVNGQPLLINDAFRAVHDFFGHAELGNSFGFKGEENAWNVHSRMFSPLARRAMTTETRGQNSYVNFSGVNQEIDAMREQARKLRAEGKEAEAQAIAEQIYELGSFADQKIGLLPEEFSEIDVNDIGDVNLQPQGLQSRDVEVTPTTEQAPVEEVTVEEEEQYEPITIKDIDHDTFTRDNASDYEEDERDGDNGRSYIYLSSITVPIVNQDGDTIGSLVKMSDGEGELTFDAEDENGNRISKNDKGFYTLGDAKKAFVEAYNKEKKKEFDKEAKKKAKEKAKQAEKAATKAAKAAAKEGAAKVEEVQAIVDDLLALDPNDKSTAQKISDTIGKAIKDIEKFEKTSLGVNVALPIVKGILQAVKVLIDAGIKLQQAIKQVAQDNNITEQQVKDNINIVPILNGFNEVMASVDKLIERQKSKQIADAKIVTNIDTFVRNSEVYQAANDAQKKILEKEARAKMGVDERRAPSIGRVLGALKDITNISKQDKIKIIRQIRGLSQDAAKSLAKEIKEMATVGKITVNQAANVISRFSKVNMLSEVSVSNFVDYMAKVFNDAEYAQKIDVVKKQLSTAKKNIAKKIGIADGLMIPLQKLFAINPNLIPDSVFDEYVALVDMFGKREAVLSLDDKSQVTRQVQDILDAINAEQSQVIDLATRLENFDNKVYNEDGSIDYAATLKKMTTDEVISEDEAEVMRKYKSDILPQAETTKKTEEEIEAEKKELIKEILDTTTAANLPSRDERELAIEFLRLRRTDAIYDLSVAELKNIIKLVENIRNGYLPHYANQMVKRLESINSSKPLESAIVTANPLSLTEAYAKVKSLFTGRSAVLEMIRRNPLANIDQIFGNFKTKEVFNSILNKPSEAAAAFQTELKKVQNILEKAEAKVAQSFKLDPNETLMSKFKMMTYLIQLEYQANPGNKQVNQAADFLKATIKHIEAAKSRFGERDATMLSEILDKYAVNKGEIDVNKLYNSFNDAEKSAIKDIQDVNKSLTGKAEYTASVIRGEKFNPLNSYVHLNVLNESQPTDLTSSVSFAEQYNNSMRPSTKAKSLIERTGKVSPLNFDVFASAQRGAKFVLLDYNLTNPITTSRMTLNQTEANLQKKADEKARAEAKKKGITDKDQLNKITGKISKQDREVFNAIRDAFEEATENLLNNSVVSNSLTDDVIDYINKQGYRAILAGSGRFVSELTSNIGFALIVDPKAFMTGIDNRGFIMSADAPLVMQNVKSKQTSRIFPTDTLSGRAIDTSILKQANGIVGGKAKSIVANKIQQIWNLSGKKYTNTVELTADALISTPDKVVMRPMWFGSFANTFKTITGQDVNFEKIVANDEAYMNQYQDAINKAKTIADERSVMTGATDNPFMGLLKGTVKPNQTLTRRAFNNFNSFMTKFLIFEYVTARTGIMAAMGNGSLTRKQGAAVLAGVTTRMVVYNLLGQMLGNGLMGMFYDDDEPEDDKSFFQKAGQAIASAFTSLVLGRDFGNATKTIVNAGIESMNEEYLDFLREGEYDPYKDAIQFSVIPKKREGKQNDLGDLLMNMGGAFGPSLKTANFLYVKATEDDKKKADAIERQEKERSIRVPLEILGNAGFIPLYKDVRKMVMKNIYSDLINAEQNLANKKMAEQEKLQGFETEGDMKRYDPELWDRTYGPSSEGYDEREAARKIKLEAQRMKRALKDEEYNYTPKADKDGFGSKKGFSDSKPKSRSKSDGFGSKDGFSK